MDNSDTYWDVGENGTGSARCFLKREIPFGHERSRLRARDEVTEGQREKVMQTSVEKCDKKGDKL